MQDRFKFRYFDCGTIYDVFAVDFLNKTAQLVSLDRKETLMKRIDTDKLIQCTGLKDKNGKLIYEGDIIVIPNQYPFYDYKNKEEYQNLNETYGEIKGETILNYVGIVEYIFNGWQYVLNCVNPLKRGISNGINHHLNEQGFEEDENSCYEVIGNIYENPELLEV